MPNRTAIFIDGAYLDNVLREEFGGARIDFDAFAQHVSRGADLLRSYYYDCPPYQGNPPTEDQRRRYANRRSFFEALEGTSQVHRALGPS